MGSIVKAIGSVVGGGLERKAAKKQAREIRRGGERAEAALPQQSKAPSVWVSPVLKMKPFRTSSPRQDFKASSERVRKRLLAALRHEACSVAVLLSNDKRNSGKTSHSGASLISLVSWAMLQDAVSPLQAAKLGLLPARQRLPPT